MVTLENSEKKAEDSKGVVEYSAEYNGAILTMESGGNNQHISLAEWQSFAVGKFEARVKYIEELNKEPEPLITTQDIEDKAVAFAQYLADNTYVLYGISKGVYTWSSRRTKKTTAELYTMFDV